MNCLESEYEMIVFVKLDKHIKMTIIGMYFIALCFNFIHDTKTNAKITKGKEKINPSLITRLIE
ncbi:MAG: hypothetical protein LBF70_00515 [Holosporales bacterium]|jgi:hypothetical protein|nr:hypothetical protein [Holosporales bacterium]